MGDLASDGRADCTVAEMAGRRRQGGAAVSSGRRHQGGYR